MNLMLLTCLGLMSILSAQASDNYHCLRNQQACAAGTCNTGTGICACPASQLDEDCATPAATATACTATEDNCDPLGKMACYSDGGVKCHCKTDYYGATCADERLTNTCSSTDITPSVVPYVQTTPSTATFAGKIYAKGHILTNTDECHLTAPTTAGEPYTKAIPITTCGVVPTTSYTATTLGGTSPPVGTLQELVMIIQYHPDFISTLDLEVTFSCFIDDDDDPVVSLAVEVAQVTGDSGFIETSTRLVSLPTGLSMEVTDVAGVPIPAAGVAFGAVIKMVVTLDNTQGYLDLHVDSLGHNQAAAPTDHTDTKYMIKDGCAQVGYQAVLVDFTKSGLTVTIQFNALVCRLPITKP